jgi:hypothetical protein
MHDMDSQAPTVGALAGVATALLVAGAVETGLILSVESLPVAVSIGVLAGLGIGAVALLAVADRVESRTRHRSVAAGLFAWIALVLVLAVSSVGIANTTALLAGVAVGALVAIGSYVWLRQQDSGRVRAVTM